MTTAAPPERAGRDAAGDTDLGAYAKVGVPALVLAAAVAAGALRGVQAVVLVLAAGALLAVIAIFWASLRTFLGETKLTGADAYALGAPRTEEEQKRAVLRALKDLEFERSVGKISEEDYAELTARYRAEAKRLLRLIEASSQPDHDRIEELIARRLRKATEAVEAEPVLDDAADDEAPPRAPRRKASGKRRKAATAAKEGIAAKEAPAAEERGAACAACGAANDGDAVFCKKCGARLEATGAASTSGDAKTDGQDDADGDGESA